MTYLLLNICFFMVIAYLSQLKKTRYDIRFLFKKQRGKFVLCICFALFIIIGSLINKRLDKFCLILVFLDDNILKTVVNSSILTLASMKQDKNPTILKAISFGVVIAVQIV